MMEIGTILKQNTKYLAQSAFPPRLRVYPKRKLR